MQLQAPTQKHTCVQESQRDLLLSHIYIFMYKMIFDDSLMEARVLSI